MIAFKQANGDLLVPLDECVAARRVHPGDPEYAQLEATAIDAGALAPDPVTDAELEARWFGADNRRTA
ncbi:hypothetical protein [Actinomadura kijaniata]|uniref:hypothetical protein n=1 Tax=Actinomadura kijaniata TaxID=46161 RepID=UPI000AD3CCF6|nr:hypothetical protein [Actinomadura kijaniata]